jgi:hypothetical protein
MIQVNYRERLGNNMFQYALGRILAESMGYELVAGALPFPATHERVAGESYTEPVEKKRFIEDIAAVVSNPKKRKVILEGFFQQSSYYLPHIEKIKKWFAFPENYWKEACKNDFADIGPSDVLMYLRLGDYYSKGYTLTRQFYLDALAMSRPRRLFIVTENPSHVFLEDFKKYNPTYISGTPIADMSVGRLFNKIIISASTFALWAAILSDATEIYFPLGRDSHWTTSYSDIKPMVDLRNDHSRFIYFYNCPTIKKNDVSPKLTPLAEINPTLNKFHTNSKAFWYS